MTLVLEGTQVLVFLAGLALALALPLWLVRELLR